MSLPDRRSRPRSAPYHRAIVLGRDEHDAERLAEFARGTVAHLAVPVTTAALRAPKGDSPDRVMSLITSQQADLVFRARASRTVGEGAALDRLDTTLIRRCPCPVWFADPATSAPPQRVLAAINPIFEDRVDQAAAILEHARRVCGATGAELHVMHAWIAFGETLLRPRMAADDVEAYVRHQGDAALRRVEWSLARAGIRVPRSRLHLLKGHFGELLSQVQREHGIDLTVMGTRGRQRGSVAALVRPYPEAMLDRSAGPLLVVKRSS